MEHGTRVSAEWTSLQLKVVCEGVRLLAGVGQRGCVWLGRSACTTTEWRNGCVEGVCVTVDMCLLGALDGE